MEKPETEEEEELLFDEELPLELSEDDAPGDLDDTAALDLDIGNTLGPELEPDSDDDTESTWNLSGLLSPTPDDGLEPDDETGPAGFDTSIGIADIPSDDLGEAALALVEPEFTLPLELAPSDDGDDEPLLFGDAELELPQECALEPAASPWALVLNEPGAFETLCLADQALFAGGEELLVVRRGQRQRRSVPSALMSLAPSPQSTRVLFGVSKRGDLLLMAPPEYACVEALASARELAGPTATLTLAHFVGPQGDIQLVAKTSSGELLSFRPESGSFERVLLPARVLALPVASDRAALLARQDGELGLLWTDSAAGAWQWRALGLGSGRSLGADKWGFSTLNEHVALAGPRQGLLLSADAGRSFTRISGCVTVSALALGKYDAGVSVWVALSHEIEGRTDLVRVEAESHVPTQIAEFESTHAGEFAPVLALAWDAEEQVLFAAGEFGVRGFAAPRPE